MKRYAWCPVCGSSLALEQREGWGRAGAPDVLICGACGFHFWQGSKPAVGAVIVRITDGEPHVLLTRRGIDPFKGMWDVPGGFLRNGEHPEDGLAREVLEELGVAVDRPRFLTVEMDEYPRDDITEEARFVLGLFYICDMETDRFLKPADDVTEARWFALDRLPDDIAFKGNRRALACLRTRLMTSRVDPHNPEMETPNPGPLIP